MSKIFNYIRVSTKEQNEQRQIVAMNEYNEANGITNAIQLIDKCSGTTKNRPNLEMLLKVVGEGDLVVIKSIDRLSRNYKEVTELWKEITSKGADIIILDMPILDTTKNKDLLGNLITDLFISILGYVAQTENDFRRQRQSEGIKVAKAEGKHLGRPKAEYPPQWDEQYKLWKDGNQTAKATMDNLGLKRTTFYKLVNQYEGKEA